MVLGVDVHKPHLGLAEHDVPLVERRQQPREQRVRRRGRQGHQQDDLRPRGQGAPAELEVKVL